jgi:hypothetical protein
MNVKSAIKSALSVLSAICLLLAVLEGVWAHIPFEENGHVVGTLPARFRATVSVDLDGDGDLDLITGSDHHTGYELVAWENDGWPFDTGWPQHNIGNQSSSVYAVAVGDLDNDGDLDIISGQSSAPRLLVWQNDGTPFDGPWSSYSIGAPPARVEGLDVGDLDNDGDLDIVSGTGFDEWLPSNNYKVTVWQNDGTPFVGTWSANDVYVVTYSVHAVAVGDLDNDGWLDIVAGVNHAEPVGTEEEPADPATWHPNYELRAYRNDGTPFAGAWPQTNVGRDPETATFASGRYHGYWGAIVYDVALADLDNDGDLDIASAEHVEGDYQVKVWQNDGTPFDGLPAAEHWTWQPTAVWVGAPWMSASVYDVTAGDFNNDGYVDLATASGEVQEIVVWENDGHPFGSSITDTTWIRNDLGRYTSDYALAVAAGDFDLDGYLDVAHGSGDFFNSGENHDVVIWRNRNGVGPATRVVVEDLATCGGREIFTATLGTGASLTVYSNSHDADDDFNQNVAVAWSLTNIAGDVTAADLTPAGNNRSATFTAHQIGAARILADHATLTDDATGFITVTLEIEAASNPAMIGDTGGTAISATLVDPDLTPVADGTVVTFTTNLGDFDGQATVARTTTGGVAAATLTGADLGLATVTVTGNTSQGWITVTFIVGKPYTVTLGANPTGITANGAATSLVTATVLDQYGHPVADGTAITFTTSLGSLPGAPYVTTTSSGVATALLTAGTTAGQATVTADAGTAQGQTTVQFTPGALHHFDLQVPSSGTAGQPFNLTIIARDQFNNVITNFAQNVSLSTTNGGAVSPTVAQGADFASGVWTGPVTLTNDGQDRVIVVASGGVSSQTTIDLASDDPLPHKIFLPAILRNP